MRFSLRPGISYMAMAIAISIVMTIAMGVLIAVVGGGGVTGTTSQLLGKGGVVLGATLLLSLGIVFVISGAMMPALCRWSSR